MTDILLVNVLEKPSFTWGSDNLARKGDVRSRYISALRRADKGFYDELRQFVRS
jgi:hypothetical protein